MLVEGPQASARPNWRAVAQATGSGLVRCNATRASTRPAPSTSGTTPSRSCASRPVRDWDQTKTDVFSEEFLLTRPLLTAIRRTEPTVLLIDETDKADIEIEACCSRCWTSRSPCRNSARSPPSAPARPADLQRHRELSEALKRRCLFLHIDFPIPISSGESCCPGYRSCPSTSPRSWCASACCAACSSRSVVVAETIDWGRTVLALGLDTIDDETIAATLGVVLKHQSDQTKGPGN